MPLTWWHEIIKSSLFTSFFTQLDILVSAGKLRLQCIKLEDEREKCWEIFHFWKEKQGKLIISGISGKLTIMTKSDNDKRSPTGRHVLQVKSIKQTEDVIDSTALCTDRLLILATKLTNNNWERGQRRDWNFQDQVSPTGRRVRGRAGLFRN